MDNSKILDDANVDPKDIPRTTMKKDVLDALNKISGEQSVFNNLENSDELPFPIEEAIKNGGCDLFECFANLKEQTEIIRFTDISKLYEEVKNVASMELNRNPSMNFNLNSDSISNSGNQKCVDQATDRILIDYLLDISKKVNSKFMEIVILFICLYKECMNEYGWDIISSTRPVNKFERLNEFTKQQTIKYFPEGANYFVKSFLPKKMANIEKSLLVQLVTHFCDWLFLNKYTGIRLNKTISDP